VACTALLWKNIGVLILDKDLKGLFIVWSRAVMFWLVPGTKPGGGNGGNFPPPIRKLNRNCSG